MSSERRLLIDALPGYEIGEEIGRGGWGVVLEASHRSLERRVAVKQLPRAFGADPAVRDRFLSEARVVASLDHPHIVPLYDFVEHEGMCLLVMELMPGGTLWDRFNDRSLTPEGWCATAVAVLTGLAHAHDNGVLHRDVKPENVLFNAAGVPKLADFGIAKVVGDGASNRTATGVIMGTPAYMAPEQGSGQPLSPATDVYAVGAVLYELLSGRLPFESTGDPLSQLFRHVHEPPDPLAETTPEVPTPLAEAVMHALAKAPDDRPAGAAAFAREIDAAACAAFGDDWLERSGVPVMASRLTLGRGDASTNRTSRETIIVNPPLRPAPSTPPPAAPPPVSAPPTPAPPALASSPPASSSPGAPPPTASRRPEARQRRMPIPALIAGVAILAGAAVLIAVLLSGPDDSDDTAGDAEADRAAAEARFEDVCTDEVDPSLCTCALERARTDLEDNQFIVAVRLLESDGDSLTTEFEQIFRDCREQLES